MATVTQTQDVRCFVPIFVLNVAIQKGCSASETPGSFDLYFQRISVNMGLLRTCTEVGR